MRRSKSMAVTAKSTETKVVTGKVRFSYVNVFEPRAVEEGQEPKYSVSILIPKSDKTTLAKIERAIEAAKQQGLSMWGGKMPANLKLPLRDGDTDRPDDPAYRGHYSINSTSKIKPGGFNAQHNPIIDPTELDRQRVVEVS